MTVTVGGASAAPQSFLSKILHKYIIPVAAAVVGLIVLSGLFVIWRTSTGCFDCLCTCLGRCWGALTNCGGWNSSGLMCPTQSATWLLLHLFMIHDFLIAVAYLYVLLHYFGRGRSLHDEYGKVAMRTREIM